MARVPEKLVKEAAKGLLGTNETHGRALMHSAFDLSDELYNFAGWLADDAFTVSPAGQQENI